MIKGFIIALGSATTLSSDISRTLTAVRNISATQILTDAVSRTSIFYRYPGMGDFGYKTIGTYEEQDIGGVIFGSKYTCPITCTAYSITAYVNVIINYQIKYAIYDVDTAALIGYTNSYTSTSTGYSWLTLTLTTPVQLTNKNYWLVVWGNSSGHTWVKADLGSAGQGGTKSQTYGTFPSTISWGGTNYRKISIYCNYSEGVVLADSLSKIYIVIRGISETLALSDTLSRIIIKLRGLNESLISTDSLLRQVYATRELLEEYSISDAIIAIRLKTIYIEESISLSSSIIKISYIYRTINSPVIISETLSRLLFRPINIGETVQITDLIGLYSIYAIQLSNSIILGSSVARIKLAVRGLDTSLTLSDTLTRQVIYIRGLNSILILLDALNKSSVYIVSIYIVSIVNSVKLVDVLGRGLSYRIAIASILAITSEITKIATEERRRVGQEMSTLMDNLKNRVIYNTSVW